VLCLYVVSFRRSLVIGALWLAVPTFLHRVLIWALLRVGFRFSILC
jgi:hypothetical protein